MDVLPFERPLGTTVLGDGRVRFRVWAPKPDEVRLRLGGTDHAMRDAGLGVYELEVEAAAGDDYWYVLDGKRLPDPCTRLQPRGLRGPSRIVDPGAWTWTDEAWEGVTLRDLVLYELHVGTFTAEGTFDAAIGKLPELARLGVTAIELMPVADFPGQRGWGYDGVYVWSAHQAYGGPEGLQRLVDAAHGCGLAVVLDLVYNHVGASGERALRAFGPYFTERYDTFWGQAMNYDDRDSGAVREWALQSAAMWVRDVHVDGVRLDAIHAIFDAGARHVLAELRDRVKAADPRALVIAESGRNDPQVVRSQAVGGLGHDAAWADDFHHALRTLLTGEREGYYAEFGRVADLAKAWRVPYVHDGGYSSYRGGRFGAPAPDVAPERHVVFSANHDQVGNRALGDRLPRRVRALAAFCTLLAPFTPMLFMGEEHGEDAPFQFFTDHIDKRIAKATREGRRREFAAFADFAGEEVPDPQDPATFERSKLTWRRDRRLLQLHADLLALRRELCGVAAEVVAYDEAARWLKVRRGPYELVMSFAGTRRSVPVEGTEVALSTAEATVQDGAVHLPARSGAVVR
jgi:maltooligosyltrehalose trehalohydrolase